METSSASCRSDIEHEEQEQAEPSRYEIQFMPPRSTTAITAASQRIEEGSTVDLPGVEFGLFLDPTPAPSLLTSQSSSHPPVSSSADSETTSIGGSNKRAGAWPPVRTYRKSRRTTPGQSEKTSRSPSAVVLGHFPYPPPALTLSRSSDAADDGGGRGHSAEVIEKEHLFDKVVTPSDVGKLNRLVIPKRYAEKFFPLNAAANEKGLLLSFEDRTGKLWRFRYSYWNTSQSYVLTKDWSRFFQEKRLNAGDTVSFCRGAAEATRGRLFIDYWRRADVRDPHRLPDLSLSLPKASGGFFIFPAAPAKLYDRSVLPWDLGSINIDASSTGSAPLAHMKPPPTLFSGFGETSGHFFSDSKRRKDGRDPHRLPGIPFRMQSVSRMPLRSTAGMNPHAPVAQPPPAMPKLKLVDPSSPSSVIPSSIKRLFQQLVQVRTIILSLGRAPPSDAWLAAVEYLASDAQLCLQDLHYLMLLARLGINHKKARSNDAGSSSKATPAGSFQFGHAVDDKIRKITSILERLINGGLELPRAVVRDDGDMLSVVALLSHCILLCRGISGITSVICIENMKDHREFPVAACDDLTCSGHGKIARMNAQTIPTCVADPIYLLPTAIRSLLYLDLSSCSDLTELPASLGTLHNLSALNLSCCFSLYMLPESLGSLECLQILVLSFCWKLLFLPLSFGNLSKLRLLDLSGCSSLEILPDSLVNLVHLENLNLSDCKRLKGIPQPFGNLRKLKYLNLSGCNRVELQVEYVRGLANLKCLTLSPQTDVHGFPDSLEYLAYHLDLSRWWKKNWVHPNCKPKAASLHLYGDHEQSIIGRLLSQGSYDGDVTSEQSVTSICIVGESGMGKTELVHRVYNDQMIWDAFNLRIWICMCDKKKLLEKIIEFITGAYCGEAPLSVLEETVREELIGKRFLLVLDDADIEEQCFWSDVLKLLNVGAEGSALIVTTKSEEVNCLVGEMQTIYLNSLSEEECFMVFQDHAFGDLDMNNYSHLANVGWKIVEKCGGNPMCVKALSGLLCHSENGLPEIGALVDGIMPALRLCYDLLPAHLKRCFKFCSLFPKDYIFVKHYIVRLWISQGFIFPKEDRQPEDTGLHYFNELFCRSFFQRSPFHNDQEDKFVVHDLFHDLAHSISRDECFRSEEPFCRLPENICHLSLVLQDSKTVVLSKEVTHLQSLLVVGRSDSRCSSTSVPVLNILHLNDIFVQGGFLSALNLSCAEILELPRSVGNMKHLRFLALNNTKINSLPSEIGQIDILETLELKDCCDLIELPESTKNLAKLRHLDVRKGPGNVHAGMPSGVGQLTDLQTLAIFNVGNDLLHCCIGDLKNLNGLRGHLRITGLENIKTGKDAREANLMGKHSIEALTMEWCYNSEEMEDDLCKEIANQVLQNLQPNSSLQELVIRNYSGNLFPIWMQDSSLCKLVSITIDDCKDCNELPSLGDLPHLKYLFIQKMNATNIIGYKSNSLATEEKHAPRFPSLEILNLWEMYDLQFWDGISDGDFPRLCRLSISRCPKLKNLPRFMSLLHLSFHFGGELPTFSELPMLKSLKIEGFHKLRSINLSLEMLMLKKLEISDCKELLSVDAPWLSVSHLKVARCPKLHFRGCSLEGCSVWEMLQSGSQTKMSLLVKNLSDTDQHDDGWNWKKYDEKDILGSKFRRSYFRCNKYSMGCMARKTAERNNDDPNTWSVTYMSEHNHPQDVPCIEPSPDLPIQLGTTRKRKEFPAHPFNAHESS